MKLGVIFDFDGVVVESVDKLFYLYISICNKFKGSDLKVDAKLDFIALNGKSIHQISHYIKNKYSANASVVEIEEYYKNKLLSVYNNIAINTEILDLITTIKSENIGISIASGCDTKLIENVLLNHGIFELFDTVVGGDKVVKAKPDPEIINCCLGFSDWDRAILIDDSNNGIVSGLLAGCQVIKYDNKSKINIKNILFNSIASSCSYLGEFEDFSFCEVGEIFENYSISDEEVWERLKSSGSYNDVTYHINPSKIFSDKNIHVYRGCYKNYRVGSTPPILAVTGVVRDSNGFFLCAKRSSANYQNMEVWDLIPSGSLSELDYMKQLETEWFEESSSQISLTWNKDIYIVYDHSCNVIDLMLTSKNNHFDVVSMSSNETSDFMWLDLKNQQSLPLSDSAIFISSLMEEL
jgi:beta-phosphoglucomutase